MYKNNELNSPKCGDIMDIKIIVSSTENLEEKKIYFQLQSRSEVVDAGYYNFNSSETFSNYKNYSVELIERKEVLLIPSQGNN